MHKCATLFALNIRMICIFFRLAKQAYTSDAGGLFANNLTFFSHLHCTFFMRCHYTDYVTKENNMTTANNTPRHAALSNRTFGCEIEFISNKTLNAVRSELRAAGINVEGGSSYSHAVTAGWKIVSDASVYGGWEAVSPVLSGIEGLREVTKVMDAIRAMGGKVNSSCGFHVHVDRCSDLTPHQVPPPR